MNEKHQIKCSTNKNEFTKLCINHKVAALLILKVKNFVWLLFTMTQHKYRTGKLIISDMSVLDEI